MGKTKEFDNIFNECLERVLIQGDTIEQCLADYPGQATELEPLLQTALAAKKTTEIKPRSEFREKARHEFRLALQEMETKRSRGFFNWQPQWATALIAVLILLLASSGTVAAAGNSLPDETLYPVKLATEALRLTLTPSDLGKVELYAKLVDKRVKEIISMVEKDKPKQVEQTAERLNDHLIAMASLVAPATEALPEQETAVLTTPPPEAAAPPAPSLAQEPPDKQPGVMKAPAPRQAPEEAPVSPKAGRGGGRGNEGKGSEDKGKKPDKESEIGAVLAQGAVEQAQALRAALKNAPESVIPALQRAIALTDSGYEEVLKYLD